MRYNKDMCFNISRLRIAVVLLIFCFQLSPLNAESFLKNIHWAGMGSVFYFAANNGVDSDPAPILPSLGFSAAWQFFGHLRLEFTEDFYFTNYEYNAIQEYPMACNPENRSALVFGFVTGIQLTGAIPISDKDILLRVYGGPVADLRIVTLAAGLNHPADFTNDIRTDAKLQTNAIREYFWGKARWFTPVAGVGMDFPISEKFYLGFDMRTWFPVYKVWAGDDTPAIDGWRFGIGFRITPRSASDNNRRDDNRSDTNRSENRSRRDNRNNNRNDENLDETNSGDFSEAD